MASPPMPSHPGLEVIEPSKLDLRTDEEIGLWLQQRHSATSEKNVWAFWNKGYDHMPPWVQRNVINWVKRLGPQWTVHLLDLVPDSETNVYHYLDKSLFPDAFNNKTMDGPHVGPHQGDIVRLPLLWKYGGVWMDVGTLLFRHIDDICWNAIEDTQSPHEMAGFTIELRSGVDSMLNGFIAAKKQNPFIKRWLDIYLALWAGATKSEGFSKHPLLRHLPLLCPAVGNMNCPPLNVAMEAFSDYLAQTMCFERLRTLIDPEDGFNGPEYFANHMLLTAALQETFHFQQVTGWSGNKQFELLATKRSGSEAIRNEKWEEAETFVHTALAETSTMKLSHGPPGSLESFLADIWDSELHQQMDNLEGTFAAYLRYGSVHYNQTRSLKPVRYDVLQQDVLHRGVLDPAP